MRKEKGFISIFLCLLLVPMVTYSTMIIDASRLQMSRVQMQSAGDLAMNAALSEYEHKLEEMYGLFAVAQNQDDIEKAVNRYFRETIAGALGTSATDSKTVNMANGLTEMTFNNEKIDENDIFNFVEMQLEEDGFSYNPIEESRVSNPMVMKGQIIDYMKYKAPVSLATNLMKKIGFLQDSTQQVDAIDKKIAYAEAVSDLEDPFKNAYNSIDRYNKKRDTYITNKYHDKKTVFHIVDDELTTYDMLAQAALLHNSNVAMWNKVYTTPCNDENIFKSYGKTEEITKEAESVNSTDISAVYEYLFKIENQISSDIINVTGKYNTETQSANTPKYEERYGDVTIKFTIDEEDTSIKLDEIEFGTTTGDDGFAYDSKVSELLTQYTKILKISEPLGRMKEFYDFSRKLASKYHEFAERREYYNYYNSLYKLYSDMYQKCKFQSILDVDKKMKQEEANSEANTENTSEITGENEGSENEDNNNNNTTSTNNQQSAVEEIKYDATEKIIKGLIKNNSDIVEQARHCVNMYEILKKINEEWNKHDKDYNYLYNQVIDGDKGGVWYDVWAEEIKNKSVRLQSFYNETKSLKDFATQMQDYITTLNSKVGELKKQKVPWEKSIEKISDETTRTQMKNDAETTFSEMDEVEAQKLTNIVMYQICEPLTALVSDIESVKFLGQQLCDVNGGLSYETLKTSETFQYSESEISQGTMSEDGKMKICPDSSYLTVDQILESYKEIKNENETTTGTLITNYDHDTDYQENGNTNKVSDNVQYYKRIDGYLDNAKKQYIPDTAETQKYDEDVSGLDDKGESIIYNEKFYFTIKNVAIPPTDEGALDADNEGEKSKSEIVNTVNNAGVDKDGSTKVTEDFSKSDDSGKEEEKKESVKKIEHKSEGEEPVSEAYKEVTENNKASTGSMNFDGMNGDTGSIPTGEDANNKDKYKDSAKNSQGSLQNAKTLLESLQNLGKNLVEDMYLEEYFTEMFTCLTDKSEKNKDNVQLLNGYKAIASNKYDKILNTQNAWYGKELEYILWGDTTLDNNINKTKTYIFLIRFAMNSIYAFQDAQIQSFGTTVASATVGWCPVLVPIVKVVITLGIAVAESSYDLKLLEAGEDVVLMKTQQTFVCTPVGALAAVTKEAKNKVANAVQTKVNQEIDKAVEEVKTIGELGEEKLKEIFNGYTDSMVESIKAQVKNQIAIPIENAITAKMADILPDGSNLKTIVDKGLENAFNVLNSGFNEDEASDPIQKAVCQVYHLMEEKLSQKIATEIKKKLNETWQNQKKIPSKDIQDGINGVIDELLTNDGTINERINSVVNEQLDNFKKQLQEKGKEPVANLKNYVNNGISNKINTFNDSTDKIIDDNISKFSKDSTVSAAAGETSNSGMSRVTMNYKEYCKVFMFMRLALDVGNNNQPNETSCLLRAAALIQANVQYAAENHVDNFKITQAYTIVNIQANAKMGTLLPWSATKTELNENSDVTTEGNFGKNYVTISYSGINGY